MPLIFTPAHVNHSHGGDILDGTHRPGRLSLLRLRYGCATSQLPPATTESLQSVPRAGYEKSTAEGTCICTPLHDIQYSNRTTQLSRNNRDASCSLHCHPQAPIPPPPHPFNPPILPIHPPRSSHSYSLVQSSISRKSLSISHPRSCSLAILYSQVQYTAPKYSCTNIQPAHTLRCSLYPHHPSPTVIPTSPHPAITTAKSLHHSPCPPPLKPYRPRRSPHAPAPRSSATQPRSYTPQYGTQLRQEISLRHCGSRVPPTRLAASPRTASSPACPLPYHTPSRPINATSAPPARTPPLECRQPVQSG